MDKLIGIYCIQNNINGKIYIGQSIDIERRWSQEKKSKRINKHLKSSMDKYGLEFFSFYIIEKCPKEDLNEREKYYISLYHSTNPEFGYNETTGGDSSFNRPRQKLSEEHKRKISESNKGRKISKEIIEKCKKTKLKNTLEKHKIDVWCLETNKIYHSIEEISISLGIKKEGIFRCLRRKSESSKGYHICYAFEKDTRIFKKPDYSKVGGKNHWKKESAKKISEKAKQRWRKMSEEQKKIFSEKLRKINTGKKLSEEHKRKISESNKGRKISKEQKNKISLFRKKYIEEHELNKKVYCLETNKIYNSILQAAKENGIKDDIEVSRCCRGKQNTAVGKHFCWLNEKENKEWDLRTNKEKTTELFGKKVFCRELNEQFDSIRDAERILNSRGFNAKRSSISKCCHDKNKTHLNMHFSFI